MTVQTGAQVTVTHRHYRAAEDRTTTGTVTRVGEPSSDGSYPVCIDDCTWIVVGDFTNPDTGEVYASNTIQPTPRPVVYDDCDDYEG